MDCREVIVLVDRYFEKRLTDIEKAKVKKHINECSKCGEVYDEMKGIFNLLKEHSDFPLVEPPMNFKDKVMNNIRREKKVLYFKKLDLKRLGSSFVAAGILIALINFGVLNYNLEETVGDVYKSGIELNQKIYDPIIKISQIFSMENIKTKINKK